MLGSPDKAVSFGGEISKLKFFDVFEARELFLIESKPTFNFTLLVKFQPLLSATVASKTLFRSTSMCKESDLFDTVCEEEFNGL